MKNLEKIFPAIVVLLGALILVSAMKTPKDDPGVMRDQAFGKLPVMFKGRVKPYDTLARSALRLISERETFKDLQGNRRPAIKWLLDVISDVPHARRYRVFKERHAGLIRRLGIEVQPDHLYSFEDFMRNHRDALLKLYDIGQTAQHKRRIKEDRKTARGYEERANQDEGDEGYLKSIDTELETYEVAAVNLGEKVRIYQHLVNEFVIQSRTDGKATITRLRSYIDQIERALANAREDPILSVIPEGVGPFRSITQADVAALKSGLGVVSGELYRESEPLRQVLEQSPAGSEARRAAEAELEAINSKYGPLVLENASLGAFGDAMVSLLTARKDGNVHAFNIALERLQRLTVESTNAKLSGKAGQLGFELFYNHFSPFSFTRLPALYLIAFLLAVFSWMGWSGPFKRGAFWLLVFVFVTHTATLTLRIYISGYPPIITLYGTAIFVGWGAVMVGLILERVFKNGIGSASVGVIGFLTLLIANYLVLDEGDTFKMPQAVLDTPFWLATHVTTVTFGYTATFFAGALGAAYLLRGNHLAFPALGLASLGIGIFRVSTGTGAGDTIGWSLVIAGLLLIGFGALILSRKVRPSFTKDTEQMLARMMYGVLCFAMLLSFVGTVLGGLWAEDSWGRFWGWDTKENGALIIVLWVALVIHARWGGMIKARGMAVLSVFGNIVTTWSWFGVNELGVGLHSYGFTEGTRFWILGFAITQLSLVIVGWLPRAWWQPTSDVARVKQGRASGSAGGAIPDVAMSSDTPS